MKKQLLALLTALLLFPLYSSAQNQLSDSIKQMETVAATPADTVRVSTANTTQSNEELQHYRAILEKKEINISIMSVLKGLLGMAVLIFIAWLFSTNRRAVDWGTVIRGLLLTATIAFLVLQPSPGMGLGSMLIRLFITALLCTIWTLSRGMLNKKAIPSIAIFTIVLFIIFQFVPVQSVFEFLGKCFTAVLEWTKAGSGFLLGSLMDVNTFGFVFAFQILPTIIFFSALTSLLFYLGIIQKVVWAMAWALTKAMGLSGPESLATAGNIFLGQTESPLMIKAYIPAMNRSEVMLIMTAGMATMAGGVLAAYIQMLGNGDPVLTIEFAKHLLSASVMAAPGAVVISKILVPQTEKIDEKIEVSKEKIGKNLLDAISNGTAEGLKLAVNVAAMLLVFYALIAGVNYLFKFSGRLSLLQDAAILGGLVVGFTATYLTKKAGGKQLRYIYYGIIGVTFAICAAYSMGAKAGAVAPSDILGIGGFIGLLTISAAIGTLIAIPLIKNGHAKKLHIANGCIAVLLVVVVVLMSVWQTGSANLNSIIATATGGSYSVLSLEFILGYAFSPVMWLIGVCSNDMTLVGQLLGQKVILTEFVAYGELSKFIATGAFTEVKSMIMATYILCGFANFASVGIQIGGIGSLAPNQKPLLASFGMRALLGGTLAALVSATMVGIILG